MGAAHAEDRVTRMRNTGNMCNMLDSRGETRRLAKEEGTEGEQQERADPAI